MIDVAFQSCEVGAGFPGNKERADLGADEVVGATGAEEGELFGVGRVDELEHVRSSVKLAIQRRWALMRPRR